MLSECSGNTNSSWAMGPAGAFTTCRSAPNCWGTNLSGNYNECEFSCVEFPALDLSGIKGRVEVSLWAWYHFENGGNPTAGIDPNAYDGATLFFVGSGGEELVAPVGGWDVDLVALGAFSGDSCSWYPQVTAPFFPYPAWGQYQTPNVISWVEKRFVIRSADAPQFFHPNFSWRLYIETDVSVQFPGIFIDDVSVRVVAEP